MISWNQWLRSKFIFRGLNFFTHREGFLGRGQRAPPHQLGGLGERCKLLQWVTGWSCGKFEIWHNLRPQNSLQKCLIMCKLLQKGYNIEGVKSHSRPGIFFLGAIVPLAPLPGSTPLVGTYATTSNRFAVHHYHRLLTLLCQIQPGTVNAYINTKMCTVQLRINEILKSVMNHNESDISQIL